ncbi:hypothetical protein JHK82_027266 [Glycine max]|uniref:Uncharacterized protein n=1 Tax=Glycine soja TaxID=3848 RepID=A0A0B2RPX4_GLYSO|nr:hypothetical protein JHK82_027266 [Glycine max]KHN34283.1 hypothetical protein glysoja_046321 [Glycine soja]
MLLKDSLSEPNLLSEAHPLSEEACSLRENKTLKNVEPESSAISAQPAHLARTLFLLALSASKPA